MNAEALEFNLQAELKAIFSKAKDDETTEALLVLQSIEETFAVKSILSSKNLVKD